MANNEKLTKSPVFLVGSERSGTTLLRLMLDHHPQVAFVFEFEFVVYPLTDPNGWPDMEGYRAFLSTDRIFRATGFMIDPLLDFPHLVDSFLKQKQALSGGKPIIGATVHLHFDRLRRIWPDARFIHLMRDPRDVARSCMDLGWAGNAWAGVQRWLDAESLWERTKPSLSTADYLDVRYENLITHPTETLTAICRFMGTDYDERMMEYSRNSTYGPPDAKMIAQWKRKMPPQEVQLVEARVGDMMAERGYELSGHPVLRADDRTVRKLWSQDRWYRRRERVRKFGWWLAGLDVLSRRVLPIRPLRDRVRLRMNDIETAHLK